MYTFIINARVDGEYTLVAPVLNDACILMHDLEANPEVISYRIHDSMLRHIPNPPKAFGFIEETFPKSITKD